MKKQQKDPHVVRNSTGTISVFKAELSVKSIRYVQFNDKDVESMKFQGSRKYPKPLSIICPNSKLAKKAIDVMQELVKKYALA